ncbi:hypothetical protein R1sor_004668 [Riccia sorocarpa]|uniref:Uncharacterized protein n=1 Tax=Riccia sorocarpa TaxID=122646 RepID=A0ABD3HKU8_9MARC
MFSSLATVVAMRGMTANYSNSGLGYWATAAAFYHKRKSLMEEEKKEPESAVKSSIIDRFQQIKDHWESYPYVWASYMVVFGGLGIYSAYRWRALRKVENELLKYQEKLKQTMTAEELEQAMKESQAGKS